MYWGIGQPVGSRKVVKIKSIHSFVRIISKVRRKRGGIQFCKSPMHKNFV